MIDPAKKTAPVLWSARLAINSFCIWLAVVGCGVAASVARAQDNLICGNLRFQAGPDVDGVASTSGSWFMFQVFHRMGDRESPVLSSTPFTPAIPSARCVGGSVLMVAFFVASGAPCSELVFQSGSHVAALLNLDDFEVRADAIIIPERPRLSRAVRERIPEEFRSLFDHGEAWHFQ